ncbi:MAG: hypothetical protein SGPRY_005777 [Prymnesium sp.]
MAAEETPLLCAQTLGSRARVLVCARAAEAYAHSLLCPGPPGQRDDPVAAFTSYCERAGETLLLAARVVAGAVSAVVQGCREEEGGSDEVRGEGAGARLVQLRARAETEASRLAGRCLPTNAVASQRREEEEGTKVEGREQVEKEGEGLWGEREEEAGEEAEEQMVEACELLRGALSTRMDMSLLMALSPLLSSQLFVSLVRTLERRLLPLNRDSPLAYECRRIAQGVRDEQAACRPHFMPLPHFYHLLLQIPQP